MRRLLIAESTGELGKALNSRLCDSMQVEICRDGDEALRYISVFEPDIMLLDLQLAGVDSLSVLHALRTSGRTTKIVVITNYIGQWELGALERLGVSQVFRKPCALGRLVVCIRELEHPQDSENWYLGLEADRLLLSLGMKMGRMAYRCAFDALCLKYAHYDAPVTKEIYPVIAKRYGGNIKQVEKAIRDAIKTAWEQGNQSIWRLYFPPGRDGELHCPGNDEFLSRLARALLHRSDMKLPYESAENAQ